MALHGIKIKDRRPVAKAARAAADLKRTPVLPNARPAHTAHAPKLTASKLYGTKDT